MGGLLPSEIRETLGNLPDLGFCNPLRASSELKYLKESLEESRKDCNSQRVTRIRSE